MFATCCHAGDRMRSGCGLGYGKQRRNNTIRAASGEVSFFLKGMV